MYRTFLKRFFDIVLSFLGIFMTLPLFLFVGILIKIDSPGKIFFRHKRCGLNGEPFYVLKFRTMVENAPNIGPSHTLPQDSRVTNIGKYLRKLSLDEIPQLINVLKGDMSLIGPRPPAYQSNLDDIYLKRLFVKPGLTGLAQVNGRSLLTQSKKLEYDLKYVENVSFLLDIEIFFKTFSVILTGKGVNSSIKSKAK